MRKIFDLEQVCSSQTTDSILKSEGEAGRCVSAVDGATGGGAKEGNAILDWVSMMSSPRYVTRLSFLQDFGTQALGLGLGLQAKTRLKSIGSSPALT